MSYCNASHQHAMLNLVEFTQSSGSGQRRVPQPFYPAVYQSVKDYHRCLHSWRGKTSGPGMNEITLRRENVFEHTHSDDHTHYHTITHYHTHYHTATLSHTLWISHTLGETIFCDYMCSLGFACTCGPSHPVFLHCLTFLVSGVTRGITSF